MATHDGDRLAHPRQPPRDPPGNKSFWQLLPRRNLRRALFLLAALIAIIAIKKMGGFSLARLFNDVAPQPAPQSQPPLRHLEVKP